MVTSCLNCHVERQTACRSCLAVCQCDQRVVKTMSRSRCERCLRPDAHCLCALIPQLDSRTRVLILQHPDEAKHALNTARFAALGLSNAQLRIGEVFEDLAELLNPPGYQPRLLFPGDAAQPLTVGQAEALPTLLVVPDGTWRKARKLLHLNPLLLRCRVSRSAMYRPHVTVCARRPDRMHCRRLRRLFMPCRHSKHRFLSRRCSGRSMP